MKAQALNQTNPLFDEEVVEQGPDGVIGVLAVSLYVVFVFGVAAVAGVANAVSAANAVAAANVVGMANAVSDGSGSSGSSRW